MYARTRQHLCARVAAKLATAATLCAALGLHSSAARAADFLKPTPEELSMTALPGYPGVAAVILFREELTHDQLHSVQHYERIKILTEEGKRYANVELGFASSTGDDNAPGDDKTLEQISGRTIHADGTVIPFTGKPYLKILEKAGGYKVQQKVFTLPDVEVGSIIEYRYSTFISDYYVESPTWMIQDNLFVKEAHFAWWPSHSDLRDEEGNRITSIAWFPILPAGAKIETHDILQNGPSNGPSRMYELHIKDVPPRVREDHMPPISSFSYRVNFSFTPYQTGQEYWDHTGKQWSKRVNSFAGPSAALRDATAKVTSGATTPDEKLHKIYAAVMDLENTRYTRERDAREYKAAGMAQIKEAADVLEHGHGTPTQLAELFLGMARASGLHAYAMWIPDRSSEIFVPYWLSTRQLDDTIVAVNVDGKDIFFDPGTRYCDFGQLAWQHTLVQGLRQTDGGTTLGFTPSPVYKNNQISRVANLTMKADGEVTGKVDLTFTGSAALRWRQAALRGDEESLRKELRESAEAMLPKTLEVEVADIQDIASFGKPLTVKYTVKGTMGSAVGKRTMLPSDVFLANTTATFTHEKRETAVYFEYPEVIRDAVRVVLPQDVTIEAVPAPGRYDMPNRAVYSLQVAQAPTSITTRRDFVFNDVLVETKDYAQLRSFYSQFQSKDSESVILKAAVPAAKAANTQGPQIR